tara:strand:- start:2245 stop:2550 length:306 start_codon:yes stop_codon:yes gene_type:complete
MKDNKICQCTAPQLDDGICICGYPINNEFDWCNDSGYNDVFHNEVSDHKDLDPTPEEWENFKKQLPKFIKEGIQFGIIITIMIVFGAFFMFQILKLLHSIL